MIDGSRSSPAGNPDSAWVRWLLPSVSDLIFVALLGLLLFTPLSVRLLGDAGIGWHIRTGQQILLTHAIPRVDPFSSTMSGKPWFAWEWLYDLVVGKAESVAGLNGVVLFAGLVIAGVFGWTFRLTVRRGSSVPVAAFLVLLAVSASMIHVQARPHVLSWWFTLVWFWLLDSSGWKSLHGAEQGSTRMVWLLPLLMLVWVNLHGGWLIGFVLLAIYWISAAWAWFRAGNDKLEDVLLQLRAGQRTMQLTLVALAAGVATLANPYGLRLHVHIYHYLSNRFLMDHIDEFQSPNFHGVAQRCFAGLLLIALVALGTKARRVRLSEVLVALFAVYAGLFASRNIPVSSLLLVIVVGPLLSEAVLHIRWPRMLGRGRAELRSAGPFGFAQGEQPRAAVPTFSGRMREVELSLRWHFWPVVAVALTCWIAMHGGHLGSKPVMNAHFDVVRFPVDAVSSIERSGSREPVLSPDYWGGYLIYRLHPAVLVVADDRHDLYGEEFFKSYLKMVHLQPGWDDLPRALGVRRILMPKGSPLANILTEHAGWRIVYRDDVAVLFEKVGT